MIDKLRNRFFSGHERSVRLRKNIFLSLTARGVGILCGLIIVPLSLAYLDQTRYGVWLTISSVLGWFAFFDIGLGNGLRNKYARAMAQDRVRDAKTYVSTTYFLIFFIAIGAILVFSLIHPFIDWGKVFKAPAGLGPEVSTLIYWVVVLFFLKFIFNPITKILVADQRPGVNSILNTLSRILALGAILLLDRFTNGSLFYLGGTITGINAAVPLIASFIFFSGRYKEVRPSLKNIDLSLSKELMGIGFQFFVMQLAAIIVFATDNMIITQLFGPAEVTPYNIAFRYFSLVLIIFRIITNPYWSAYTEAYTRNDLDWIRRVTKRLVILWGGIALLLILMFVLAEPVYRLWLGEEYVPVPILLSLFMAIWVGLSCFTTIFGNFLSGSGKVRLSMIHSMVFMVINIPLSIFLAKWMELGPKGVILATFLSVLPQGILHPIQYRKIMKGTAKGVWNK